MKIFLVIRIFVISLYSDSGMNLTHRGGSRINERAMRKTTTTNLAKAGEWINNAVKGSASVYFRFVSYIGGKDVRGEWLTPERAYKEFCNHDEFNTLRVERIFC